MAKLLKPQDVLVALKSTCPRVQGGLVWTHLELAVELGLSPSEVHQAVKRLAQSGLTVPLEGRRWDVNVANFVEFVVHGLRYVFFAERGAETRGIATGHAAPV